MILFPRLRKIDAERLFQGLATKSISELGNNCVSLPDEISFAQTGGRRISTDELGTVRRSICDIAARFGFPNEGSDRAKAEFDAECAAWLKRDSGIEPGEAFRDPAWAYLTVVLLPDIAAWRFQKRNIRRFIGGVRNTFQRLWRRAFLLDHAGDPEILLTYLRSLQEDSFVQLIERPGFSANPYVASRIAAAWVRASGRTGRAPMEATHRKVMKELTQIGAVISLDCLSETELDAMLNALYLEFGAEF